jgi:hypothetical protein
MIPSGGARPQNFFLGGEHVRGKLIWGGRGQYTIFKKVPLFAHAVVTGLLPPPPRRFAPSQKGPIFLGIPPPGDEFSMTFNFNIFHCFSNIRDHIAILAIWSAYLVKCLSVDGFICQLKTENSRRVAESRLLRNHCQQGKSRLVCMGLYTFENLTLQN